jgi:dihydroxyacetone kinase-like protein
MERVLVNMATRVHEKRDWLSRLDAACGDGDHGVSMDRGFEAVRGQLGAAAGLTPGALLEQAGRAWMATSGGAIGPLLGTLFREAGKAAGTSAAVDASLLAGMLRAGLEGVKRRGGAKPGDKTLLDALEPAADELERAAAEGAPIEEALQRAAAAARAGAEATAGMVARQGKSRSLGERSLGHPDAGAHSIALLFEVLAETVWSAAHENEETDQRPGSSSGGAV